MAYPQLSWSPTADAALASPADFDLNHPVWMNEVLTAKFANLWVARTVRNATPNFAKGNLEAEFVVTGRLGTQRYNKGDEYRGMDRKQIKRTIGLNDRPYYTAITDEKIVRMFEQVNTRAPITEAMGHALAARTEVEVMRRIIEAANFTNANQPSEFRKGGNYYVGAEDGTGLVYDFTANQTGAKNLQKAIKDANKALDKLSAKKGARFSFVPVDLYYEFLELENVHPSSTNTLAGGIYGNLDIAGPKHGFQEDIPEMVKWKGVTIMPHNLIEAEYDPEVGKLQQDWSGDPDVSIDCSSTIGAIYQAECVGHVDVMTTSFQIEDVPLTEMQQVRASNWTGGGSLMPELAFELVQSS